ncbi:4013_t:CDS:2, partial [Funneliformis geosporum]
FINKSRFEDSEHFNAAGSMSSYAPMKCSLLTERTCITELLQLTDSKEETGHYHEKRTKITKANNKRKSYAIYKDLDNDEQVTERLSSKTGKPEAFREMTNAFEVYQWLIIKRPDILTMANQMYHAFNILCRVPPDEAIENLVKKIFDYDLCNNDAEEVICHSKRVLTDFCSKFNKRIAMKVNELKERRSRKGLNIIIPTRTEIEEFMSQEIIKQILYRYLTKTDRTKLKKCDTMERLVLFAREAFIVYYTKYNVKAIKKLDSITIGYKVPSRYGKNIASRLSLGDNEQ